MYKKFLLVIAYVEPGGECIGYSTGNTMVEVIEDKMSRDETVEEFLTDCIENVKNHSSIKPPPLSLTDNGIIRILLTEEAALIEDECTRAEASITGIYDMENQKNLVSEYWKNNESLR